jgi:hypothetical protein
MRSRPTSFRLPVRCRHEHRQLHLDYRRRRLRGVYVRGKYRDLILAMTVIRPLDAVLEPTKAAVLAKKDEVETACVH